MTTAFQVHLLSVTAVHRILKIRLHPLQNRPFIVMEVLIVEYAQIIELVLLLQSRVENYSRLADDNFIELITNTDALKLQYL